MKALYWRPQTTSPRVLLVIGLASIAGLMGLYFTAGQDRSTSRMTETAAAHLADKCLQAIKAERIRRGHNIDVRFDPHQTGIIGAPMSTSTSKVANLSAKQVSVNPNFAATVIRMLTEAGVKPGDTVAIGWSGSFPALNVALSAAIETLDLKPVIVASALSSQYGANIDDFLWLDMEQHLASSKLVSFRSNAMTIGGAADRAYGQSREVKEVVEHAHERTGVEWLGAKKLLGSVDARMQLYERLRGEQPIVAYINVGGGIASMGGTESTQLRPGVNRRIRALGQMPDCVARRFAEQDKVVIHLAQARVLATRYGLNTDMSQSSNVGVGPLFEGRQPNRTHAGLMLIAIGLLIHAFVCRDYGYRLFDRIKVACRAGMTRKKDFRIVGSPVASQLMV